MKIYLKVVNPISPLRQRPGKASMIKFNLNPDDDILYMASKLYMGWYYIEDGYDGWIESIDVKVVKVEEPYDPSEDYGFNTEEVNNSSNKTTLNGAEIIEAINKSSKSIMANKIVYKSDDNEEIPIYTLLTKVLTQFEEMEDIVNNLGKYPDIPSLPNGNIKDYVLIANKNNQLVWKKLDVSNLSGIAEFDERYTNEF